MEYNYKMVQLSPTITVTYGKAQGTEAAAYLQSIVSQNATGGWEFYRVDEIGVTSKPGCFAGLLGAKETYVNYYVATFRKPV